MSPYDKLIEAYQEAQQQWGRTEFSSAVWIADFEDDLAAIREKDQEFFEKARSEQTASAGRRRPVRDGIDTEGTEQSE